MEEIKNNLINCVKNHDLETLKSIIKEYPNFDYTFTDSSGKTLLHYAIAKTSSTGLSILQELLQKNVDPNSVDENFETPLEIARKINNTPGLAIFKFYIAKKEQELKSLI